MEKEKNRGGRPRITGKSYHYKADIDVVPILDAVDNRNRFINDAVRAKIKHDKLKPPAQQTDEI